MTLEKAIERLSYSYHHNTILINHLDKDALKLGIEALKRIQFSREADDAFYHLTLPGETKE